MVLAPAALPLTTVQPSGWARPSGCAHAVVGTGTFIFVGGQVATDENGRIATIGLIAQARQALRNIRTVLDEVGATPGHVAQMTWFVLDIDLYRARQKELEAAYREVMGFHVPAVSLVEVTGLANPDAIVEIAATAILPEDRRPHGSPPGLSDARISAARTAS
jgi:enamine deaminase RidA (YjgF/YER057c/UK114 family)